MSHAAAGKLQQVQSPSSTQVTAHAADPASGMPPEARACCDHTSTGATASSTRLRSLAAAQRCKQFLLSLFLFVLATSVAISPVSGSYSIVNNKSSSAASSDSTASSSSSAYISGNRLRQDLQKKEQQYGQVLLQELEPPQRAQQQPLESEKDGRHGQMHLQQQEEEQQQAKRHGHQQHIIDPRQGESWLEQQQNVSIDAKSGGQAAEDPVIPRSSAAAVIPGAEPIGAVGRASIARHKKVAPAGLPERDKATATAMVEGTSNEKPAASLLLHDNSAPRDVVSFLESSLGTAAESLKEEGGMNEKGAKKRVEHASLLLEQQLPGPHAEQTANVAGVEGANLSTVPHPSIAILRSRVHTAKPIRGRLDVPSEEKKDFGRLESFNKPPGALELESFDLTEAVPTVRDTSSSSRNRDAAIAAATRLLPPETTENLHATLEQLKQQREIAGLLQRLWQQHIRLGKDMREVLHEYLLSLERDQYSQQGEAFLYDQALRKTLLLRNKTADPQRAWAAGTDDDEMLALLQDLASHHKRMHALHAKLRLLPPAEKPQEVVQHIAALERPTDVARAVDAHAGSNVNPLLELVRKDVKQEKRNFKELLRLVQKLLEASAAQEAAAAAAKRDEDALASTMAEEEDRRRVRREEEMRWQSSDGTERADGTTRSHTEAGAAGTETARNIEAEADGESLKGRDTETAAAAKDKSIDKEEALELLDSGLNPLAGPVSSLGTDFLPLLSAEDTQYLEDLDAAYESSMRDVGDERKRGTKKEKRVTWTADLQQVEAPSISPAAVDAGEESQDGTEGAFSVAASRSQGSRPAEEKGAEKKVFRVLRRRAVLPWYPETSPEAGFFSLIQLSSNRKQDEDKAHTAQRQEEQQQRLTKEKVRHQSVHPHVLFETKAKEAVPHLREIPAVFPSKFGGPAKEYPEFSDPTAAETSLLMAAEETLAATEAAAEAAAATERRRLATEASFLGGLPFFRAVPLLESGAAAAEDHRGSSIVNDTHGSLRSGVASSAYRTSGGKTFYSKASKSLLPVSHLQEQVRQSTLAKEDENELDEDGGSEVDEEEEGEEGSHEAGKEKEKEKGKAAPAAGGAEEKKKAEKTVKGEEVEDESTKSTGEEAEEDESLAFGTTKKGEEGKEDEEHEEAKEEKKEKEEGKGGKKGEKAAEAKKEEEAAEAKKEKEEEAAEAKREKEEEAAEAKKEKEEEAAQAKKEKEEVAEALKEKEEEKEEKRAEAKEKKEEAKYAATDEEHEEKEETKKKENTRLQATCTNIEDPEKCIAEPRCFHDEVYHQCFFNCTTLVQPDECSSHISCRYERILPHNACVNEGYQSTSIGSQSFEGILRGCEEFRKKEACEMMAAASKRLTEKGVPVAYNCQWLDSLSEVPSSPSAVSALQLLEGDAAGLAEANEQSAEVRETVSDGKGAAHGGGSKEAGGEPRNQQEGHALPPIIGAASLCVNMKEVPTTEGLTIAAVLAQKQKDLRDLESSRNVSVDQICPFPEELAANAKLEPSRPFYAVGDTVEVECLPGYTLLGTRRVMTCEGKSVFSPRVECTSAKNLSPAQLQYMQTIEKYANFTTEHPDLVRAVAAAAASSGYGPMAATPTSGVKVFWLPFLVLSVCCLL